MKLIKVLSASAALLALSVMVRAQSPLDPAQLLLQPTANWPTYNGDYSGRRFSPLTKINATTVKSLSLAWTHRAEDPDGGRRGARISGSPLVVNGVMYFSINNHIWAIDARTGQDIWRFDWKSKGGSALGNRGVGISGSSVYMETPDCNLVSVDIMTGKEKWHTN
ncbi:MAG: PQQ-binding-like beta-propeller repeat protein, partial [Granulicella sp.]